MPTPYRQLKPRPGSSGKAVAKHQRGRLQVATIELVDAGGYDTLTVAAIVDTAGVSKHTFYENFRGKEDCFLATYEVIVRHAAREILAARGREEDPRARVRAGILAFVREVAARPKAARLALVGVSGAGDMGAAARLRTYGLFEALVNDTLDFDDGVVLPPLLLKGVVAGISHVARSRLLTGGEGELPDSVDELTDWVLSLRSRAALEVCGRSSRPKGARDSSRNWASGGQPFVDRAEVPGDERAMLLAAVVQLAGEDGNETLTVTRIRMAAGVSKRRFDSHFDGVADCFLAALELLAGRALLETRDAYLDAGDWQAGVHKALVRLCSTLTQDPALVRMGFLGVLVAEPLTVRWRANFVSNMGSLLFCSAPPGQRPTKVAAEASAAAAMALLHHNVTTGRARQLPVIAGALSYLALAPAIGGEAAAAVIGGKPSRPTETVA